MTNDSLITRDPRSSELTSRPLLASSIPVTCFTGFLGAGKTSTILSLLSQLPPSYKCVLLKNEYGDVEVDSLLASQSQITGVSEILNGCLCCTMVGLVENALIEIRDKFSPDRIIIESSGSAFPATLALQIRQLEPQGFKLDGVVTVIDCVNFKGYEDTSPSAKLQAQYTDIHLLNKHELVSEREMDDLLDRLGELTDSTPHIKVGKNTPLNPSLIFGLDTKLFQKVGEEKEQWTEIGMDVGKNHSDEVETRTVWKGGNKPGSSKTSPSSHNQVHTHENGQECRCKLTPNGDEEKAAKSTNVEPLGLATLESALSKLPFEIYRVKGLVRMASSSGYTTHILNYAFGRHELTPAPSLDEDEGLRGVSLRLTMMGERGEVMRRAKKLAEALSAEFA